MAIKVQVPKEDTPPAAAGIGAIIERKIQARSVRGLRKRFRKILAIGKPGRGKSEAIAGLLRAGLRVFVIDTELGGTGLATVEESLIRSNDEALLDNIVYVEFSSQSDYKSIEAFFENPALVEIPDVGTIYDFNPDIIVWEGFSNYQNNILEKYCLEQLAPFGKGVTEAREEGLEANRKDWDRIKRGTLYNVQLFLALRDKTRDKDWHKYMTVHLAEPKEIRDEKTDVLKKSLPEGPLLQGAARELIQGGFDLIIKLERYPIPGKTGMKYVYECAINNDSLGKSRGLPVDPVEPADMQYLWCKITGDTVKAEELKTVRGYK